MVAVAPSLAVADTGFELTPFVGYRWGGEIRAENNDLYDTDLDIDNGVSFGLIGDFPVTQNMMLELLASRQNTELVDEGGLFGDDEAVLDVDVSYYHIGLLYQWPRKDVTGFIVGTIGVGQMDVDARGIEDEEEFSASFGGGFKLNFTRNLALRIDGRFYWTDTDKQDWDWDDCDDDDGCWRGDYGNDLVQQELKIGLAITF
jgi:hypothetical protein